MAFGERKQSGTFLTNAEVVWISTGTGGVTQLKEGTAPSGVSGYGQLYVLSSDHNLYYITAGGTIYQLTPTTSNLLQKDIFTSTANQTAFTATKTVVSDLLFIVNGQPQTPGSLNDYTVTGNVATLNTGIPANLPVQWLYLS